MVRSASREGSGDSVEGRYGSLGVRDSYAVVRVRCWFRWIWGSALISVLTGLEESRSYAGVSCVIETIITWVYLFQRSFLRLDPVLKIFDSLVEARNMRCTRTGH